MFNRESQLSNSNTAKTNPCRKLVASYGTITTGSFVSTGFFSAIVILSIILLVHHELTKGPDPDEKKYMPQFIMLFISIVGAVISGLMACCCAKPQKEQCDVERGGVTRGGVTRGGVATIQTTPLTRDDVDTHQTHNTNGDLSSCSTSGTQSSNGSGPPSSGSSAATVPHNTTKGADNVSEASYDDADSIYHDALMSQHANSSVSNCEVHDTLLGGSVAPPPNRANSAVNVNVKSVVNCIPHNSNLADVTSTSLYTQMFLH